MIAESAPRTTRGAQPCRPRGVERQRHQPIPRAETLAVDAVAVIRPKLSEAALAEGLARAARPEGNGCIVDFFRSDHLVCTKVGYRAFNGLEGLDE